MSTLEEGGVTKGGQVSATNVEVEQNTSSSDDVSQERNTEESNEWQETPNDTVTVVQRPGHGHFVPYHFRPDDQRIRRMFRQFVNRSRPQSTRSADIVKGSSCFFRIILSVILLTHFNCNEMPS